MTPIKIDPFATEEMPSRAFSFHLFWEHDLIDNSTDIHKVISYFLDQISEEQVTGIELVTAWIIAVRDYWRSPVHQGFPMTNTDYPLFPIVIDIMQLEPSVQETALAFYSVADPNYVGQVQT